jgi:subtilase family serine protease
VIGVVAVSAIDPADVELFRQFFGLPAANIGQQGGPGIANALAQLEAALDATWSGAIAPGARIEVDVGAMVVDSLSRLVNRADVGIISLSIDLCGRGPAFRQFIRQGYRLFRQAAAQGQTVLAASGDMGPMACGRHGTFPLSSSPFVTSVGGTTPSPVLDAEGNATGFGTEVVWNIGSMASGGGVSRLRRPRYQSGPRRTVPDIAFPAAILYPLGFGGHVGCCIGGTSAAAPAWAGVIALLNQMRGGRVGFLNPALYNLGRAQRRGGPAAFHDVTEGTNGIAGARGFSARTGYDLVTGWGTLAGDVFFTAFP